MKLNVLKQDGSKGSAVTVDDTVFGIVPNKSVVHQAVVAELANSRQGTHASKNRSAVRGGGRKPFAQKGRGAARAGYNPFASLEGWWYCIWSPASWLRNKNAKENETISASIGFISTRQ